MFKFKLLALLTSLAIIFFPIYTFADKHDETVGQYIKGSTVTADIKARYLADADIKSLDISVTTEKGIVTLTGTVDSQAQIDKAVHIAKQVKGVKSVNNKLTLKVSPDNN